MKKEKTQATLATLASRNRLTIPQSLLNQVNGARTFNIVSENGTIILYPLGEQQPAFKKRKGIMTQDVIAALS